MVLNPGSSSQRTNSLARRRREVDPLRFSRHTRQEARRPRLSEAKSRKGGSRHVLPEPMAAFGSRFDPFATLSRERPLKRVRRETGKRWTVEVRHGEGAANRTGPE